MFSFEPQREKKTNTKYIKSHRDKDEGIIKVVKRASAVIRSKRHKHRHDSLIKRNKTGLNATGAKYTEQK